VSPAADATAPAEGYTVIQENMVLTFEPGVYDPEARMGMNVAETLVVTRNGSRRLGSRELQLVRV
jgi:Xaa-Pro aminopeptidase